MRGTEACEVICGKRSIRTILMTLRCVRCLKNPRCTTDTRALTPLEIFWIPYGFCIMCIFPMTYGWSIRSGIGKFFYKNKLPIKYIGWINYE